MNYLCCQANYSEENCRSESKHVDPNALTLSDWKEAFIQVPEDSSVIKNWRYDDNEKKKIIYDLCVLDTPQKTN